MKDGGHATEASERPVCSLRRAASDLGALLQSGPRQEVAQDQQGHLPMSCQRGDQPAWIPGLHFMHLTCEGKVGIIPCESKRLGC